MNRNEELWRKHKAYLTQFTSFILKRANNDSKVNLALNSLLLASLYQALALVLVPKCPEDFQAQADAVMSTLDRVLDFLNSASKETEDQLHKEVVTRFDGFLELIGRCAGFEVKITDNPPDQALGCVYGGERKVKFLVFGKPLPQVSLQAPSPKLIEQAQGLARAFEGYHNQLVDYILQKAGKDKYTLLAIKGFELAYLFNDMALVLLYPCPWIFTGESLEQTVDELRNMIGLLNKAYRPEDSVEDEDKRVVEAGRWAFAEMDYLLWKRVYLEEFGLCFGIDLDLEFLPKGNAMEIVLVNYQPLPPQAPQDSPGGR